MNKRILAAMVLSAAFLLLPVFAAAQETEETGEDQMIQVVDENGDDDDGGTADGEADGDTIQVVDDDSDSISEEEVENGTSLSGDTDVITVSTEMGVQSVVTGKIPLIIRVTPHVDSRKAQVRWDLPRGLVSNDPVDVWFEMEKDVVREFRIEVEPAAAGNFETVVDVTAWRYDTNYVSSATFRFDIDEELTVTPPPEAYTRSLMLFRVALALMALIAIIVAIFAVKFGIKQFKQWLAED
jgi:hypothetical protein